MINRTWLCGVALGKMVFLLLGIWGLAMAAGCILDFHPLTPQDYYGKVIDQTGAPVIGADVKATVVTRNPNYLLAGGGDGTAWADPGDSSDYQTKTDANGLFQFNVHGLRLYATPSKEGYVLDGRALHLPADGKTSPADRAVFTMWKLKGAEPMVHAKVHAYVPCDGTATSYDVLTGRKATNGDLVITLTRNPVQIVRGKPFDWTATVQLKDGGLIPITAAYPNEAPADGYQSTLIIQRPANAKNWDAAFRGSYYFKTENGKIYGRISVNIQADFQPPPTLFDVEIYANPAGSRNLEFDAAKQIKP